MTGLVLALATLLVIPLRSGPAASLARAIVGFGWIVAVAHRSAQIELTVDDQFVYLAQMRILRGEPFSLETMQMFLDPLFTAFLWGIAHVRPEAGFLFFCVALLMGACVMGTAWCMRRQFSNVALIAVMGVSAFGVLGAYSTVALRQGLAMAAFSLACGLLARPVLTFRLVIWGVLLSIVAVLFHWSAWIVAPVPWVARWMRRREGWAIGTWCVTWIAIVIGIPLVGPVAERLLGQRYAAYADESLVAAYGTSATQFALFNLGLVALLWAVTRLPHTRLADRYWLVLFVTTATIYNLTSGIAYGDRVASYAWFLAPFAFAYYCGGLGPTAVVGAGAAIVSGVLLGLGGLLGVLS